MARSESLCRPNLHVWRRQDSERHRRISPHSFCDCMDKRFGDVAHGDSYDVAYVDPSGVLMPRTGPRTRGVGND